jgi:phosphocarrier protein
LPQDAAEFDAGLPISANRDRISNWSFRQDPIVEPRCAFPGPGLGSFFVGPEPNTKEPPGRHLRKCAGELDFEVTIAHAGEPADETMDAASILSLMSLGASPGDVVVLRADGEGARPGLDTLVKILETDHDSG